jgi:hypothetical protein
MEVSKTVQISCSHSAFVLYMAIGQSILFALFDNGKVHGVACGCFFLLNMALL